MGEVAGWDAFDTATGTGIDSGAGFSAENDDDDTFVSSSSTGSMS